MADADKAEGPGAAGHDSPRQQPPAEPPAEPRREPPPETEKQPQLGSGGSGANGVKMYCLFLRGRDGAGVQVEAGAVFRGRVGRAGSPGSGPEEQVQPGRSQASPAGRPPALLGGPARPGAGCGVRGPARRHPEGPAPPCALLRPGARERSPAAAAAPGECPAPGGRRRVPITRQ